MTTLKAIAAKVLAARIDQKTKKWSTNPIETQEKLLKSLINQAKNTAFGMDHDFENIQNHQDFVKKVPVRDYEALKPYVNRVIKEEQDVLWPGLPSYFAKTSGTTSGAKYIPITPDSMKQQVRASRDAILSYVHETQNADLVTRKMIFLQGSPKLDESQKIKTGRLSGISAHYVPNYLQKNRLPSWETNCIEDWETKVEAIVGETIDEDMGVIAGIPSWVQMYFEKLKERSGQSISDLFKNFQLFIYGGVNYKPYKAKFIELMGKDIDSIELFPASEGFFAYQDKQSVEGMLLCLDHGIYYEFIEAEHFFDQNPKRLTIAEVKKGVNYAMIISTNAGLWAYNIGDTVQFVSTDPYRVIVSGRIKHFISAFGEHVIAKEVEYAMKKAMDQCGGSVIEFTVAPQIVPKESELPYHEWFVEFEKEPKDLDNFINTLDTEMQSQNSYYYDLISGNVLQKLIIRKVSKGGFTNVMKKRGKLGGQNKIQRLSNDRSLADELTDFIQ